MNSIRASIRQPRGRREAHTFSTTAIAILLLAAACGGSQTSTAPSSSGAPSTAAAPTKSAIPAAPAAGLSADLTFSGAINGHVTRARAGSSKIYDKLCGPQDVKVGVTVDGHDYTVTVATLKGLGEAEVGGRNEALVFITGEDIGVVYMGTSGKVNFKTLQSAVFDVGLDWNMGDTGFSGQKVHLSGSASC